MKPIVFTPRIDWPVKGHMLSLTVSRDVQTVLVGTLGGVLGTVTMSALMLAAHKARLMGRLPPERITQKAFFHGFRSHKRERRKNMLAALLHIGFGAAAGAFFGFVYRRLPVGANPVGLGSVYGSLIWFLSYGGWAPALGMIPPIHRDRPGRPAIMVLAHWVYGATLGVVIEFVRRDQ